MFSLSTGNGGDIPFGTYGVSINSTADNGSTKAYYGDLEFEVTRTSGLSTDDFILNTALGAGVMARHILLPISQMAEATLVVRRGLPVLPNAPSRLAR